jgi:hypothetical protein
MEAEPSTVEPGPTEGSSQQEADSAVGSEQGSATSDAQGAKASGPPSSAAVTPVPAGVLGATGTVTEGPRVEVSAATVTRMMGIATAADLRLLEGRMDLLASKVTGLLTKVDRVLSMFNSVPSSSDIGRLEIQIGALKSMLRELLEVSDTANAQKRQAESKEAAEEQGRKLREGIRSSSE